MVIFNSYVSLPEGKSEHPLEISQRRNQLTTGRTQLNSSDCGIFVLAYAECVARSLPLRDDLSSQSFLVADGS
jgi:Ulp1 family protease